MTATPQRLLDTLVERANGIFSTAVTAIDAEGHILASCPRVGDGRADGSKAPRFEVPFSVFGQTGVMSIEQPAVAPVGEELARNVIDLLVDQISLLDCLPQQHELKNQFVHRLLNGGDEDEEDLLREGQILGMDLSRPRAVLLIDGVNHVRAEQTSSTLSEDSALRDWLAAQTVIRRIVHFFSLPSDAICAYLGKGEIAVLKASSSLDLGRWVTSGTPEEMPNSWSNLEALKLAARQLLQSLQLGSGGGLALGIGRYHPGIRGLARSYQDARAALAIGRKLFDPRQPFCLDQLGLAALIGITDEEMRLELASHLLGPLENEPELLETLIAFFKDNCSVALTSNSLYIHRNTLSYRLEKVTSLIGLNPKVFEEAMLIHYALIICQLSGRLRLCNQPILSDTATRDLYNRTKNSNTRIL
jgi:carbohydrate diacid regulator